ncbi:MAG: EamA family transporter, partial [Burkholderiaceae bacterium]|nr:EamA family transporter [Burkholderiaceae bacterium]
MASEKHFVRGMLCTLAGGIFWGFSGVCCQYIFDHNAVEPLWLTAWRMLLAGGLLLAMCFVREAPRVKAMLVDQKTMVSMLFYCILAVAGAQFLYLTTIDHSNAGTATVL